MTIHIAIPREKMSGERRVAIIPEVASKLIQRGFSVAIESRAGENAFFPDEHYQKVGVVIQKEIQTLFREADIVLTIQSLQEEEIPFLKENAILIGFLAYNHHPEQITKLREKKVVCFAMEKLPRVTRAQSMDILSSQSTVAGYKATLIAANLSPRFFPMLTTAAGTIRPAKILVLGAGVAGLQAIATARRLGAVVEAYDVRRTVKEQVESLGARFLEIEVDAETKGGYARELTAEEKRREQEMIATHVQNADCIITTAQIPNHRAPLLLSEEMVLKMKPGSVVVDLAAESGGNCALTRPGEVVEKNGVTISGPFNVPSGLPIHASEMVAKNLYNFIMLLTKDGKSLNIPWEDEIIRASALTGVPL